MWFSEQKADVACEVEGGSVWYKSVYSEFQSYENFMRKSVRIAGLWIPGLKL
jgi:hypothetical protein